MRQPYFRAIQSGKRNNSLMFLERLQSLHLYFLNAINLKKTYY